MKNYFKKIRHATRPYRRWLANKIAPQPSGKTENKVEVFETKLASQNPVETYLARAEAATKENLHHEAVRALRFALRVAASKVEIFCLEHSSIALRQNYFLAMAGLKLKENPRIFQLFQPCALLERFKPQLDPRQRETILRLVETHQSSWESQTTPQPRYKDVYRKVTDSGSADIPVVIVMPKYVCCDPACLISEVTHHVQVSATEAGLKVHRFDADQLTHKKSPDFAHHLQRLENFLDEKRPALVVFDGNYFPKEDMIDVEILAQLKKRFNFKIMTMIGDLYDHTRVDCLSYWAPASDLSVIFHRYTWFYDSFPSKEKVLVCPTLPFGESIFRGASQEKRDLDISYIGSGHRNRRLYMDVARHSGLRVSGHIHDHDRPLSQEAPGLSTLADIYGRSKIIFNNGWHDDGEAIITGRIGEVILSGAMLLQEHGAPIHDYMVPFVHYVPFANMHQFIAMAQFFLSEENWRQKIAVDAHRFLREHYSTALFWKAALGRLNLP